MFDPSSVCAEEIRREAGYGGSRILIAGTLANARCKAQIDVGFGDAVLPGPVEATYPVVLPDMPAPRLRTYPVYSVIAEKFHAIAVLGMTNTRMKDYFDLSVMLARETLDRDMMARAIRATFDRRGTVLPTQAPIGLSPEFARDPSRQALWRAFLKKTGLAPESLVNVVDRLRRAWREALNPAVR